MICDIENLGIFDQCEPVSIEFVMSPTILKNLETKFRCEFPSGVFGVLAPGSYLFAYELETYSFTVE